MLIHEEAQTVLEQPAGQFCFLLSLIVADSLAVAVALIQVDTGSQQWMAR